MELIYRTVGRRIDVPVRRADDEKPFRAKDPADFFEEGLLIVEVLDGLEGDNDVEGGVGRGELGCVARGEPEVVGAIAFIRVGDRLLGNVDAHDRARGLRQIGAAETFAGGDIEDIAIPAELAGKKIPMEMLIDRLSLAVEGEALAGEAKLLRRPPRLEDFTHPVFSPPWLPWSADIFERTTIIETVRFDQSSSSVLPRNGICC